MPGWWPSFPFASDWVSIIGMALSIVNTAGIFWIGRRVRFNIRADEIIGEIERYVEKLANVLGLADAGAVREAKSLLREIDAVLIDVRTMTRGELRRDIGRIRGIVSQALSAAGDATPNVALEQQVETTYTELRGLSRALRGLRDRRRASP